VFCFVPEAHETKHDKNPQQSGYQKRLSNGLIRLYPVSMISSSANRTIPLLDLWSRDPTVSTNVVEWHLDSEKTGQFAEIPDDLHPALRSYLHKENVQRLYAHQGEAWQNVRSGSNVVIVTGTASGKTLCYNLPTNIKNVWE